MTATMTEPLPGPPVVAMPTVPPVADAPKRRRDTRLDVLRGLFLLLMTANHLPNPWHEVVVQPIGFLSVAEGFVFLAAVLSGLVFSKRLEEKGPVVMRQQAWRRARLIYGCHLGLLAVGGGAALAIGASPQPMAWIFGHLLDNPAGAALSGALLLYQPSFHDILPLYIGGLLLTPLVLSWTRRHGWWGVAAVSALLWLGAQLGLRQSIEGWLGQFGVVYLGAFNPFAWQALWLAGLFLGQQQHLAWREGRRVTIPRGWAWTALGAVIGFTLLRHTLPHLSDAWQAAIYPGVDKWPLAPGRVVNLAAMVAVCLHFSPHRLPQLPPFPFLERLGRQSLPVFVGHVPLALAGVTWVHVYEPPLAAVTVYYLLSVAFLWRLAGYFDARSRVARAAKASAAA